jgi:hypothetical protein
MALCEQVTRTTKEQRETLDILGKRVMTVFTTLQRENPYEKVWIHILKNWRGNVVLGSYIHVPEYSNETGCLAIGLDSNGSKDILPRLTARLLMKVVRETLGNMGCLDELRATLDRAHKLEIPVELSCDDIRENGLHDSTWADDRHCSGLSEGGRRMTFPELLGRKVSDAVAMVRRGYPYHHVVTRRWDMMGTEPIPGNYRPNETVIIHYDSVSGKVVLPEPQLASMAVMNGVNQHCFMLPEEGRCIGAPMRRPKTWDRLIGKLLIDANDTLRFHYPHAVIETMPNTARIEPTQRRDRIRVLFDPKTAMTTDIILG